MKYSEPIWRIGDKLLLFLWNQFSLERIWILRVCALVYLGHSLMFNSLTQSTLHLILFSALMFLDERKNKRPKSTQNSLSVMMRSSFVGIFFAILIAIIMTLSVAADAFIRPHVIISDVSWGLYFLAKDSLVSEEPPKRWKLKIKLPKFEFNNPLPQGA